MRKCNSVVDPQRSRRAHLEANIVQIEVRRGGLKLDLELVAVDCYARPIIARDDGVGQLRYDVTACGCCGCLLEVLAGADLHGGGGVRYATIIEEKERKQGESR